MNSYTFWIYLAIMAISTYLIRALPFVAIKRKIKNPFLRSFLYYIPYTVLAAMTFPAALYATGSVIAALLGLAVAFIFAIRGASLTVVAIAACVAVFITQLMMTAF